MWHKPGKKQGLFRRIFLLYAFILLLATIAIELSLTEAVRNNYINTLKETLAVQAELAAGGISFRTNAPLDKLCRQFKEKTGSRMTIIALDGRVLGDSDTASARMDNHAHRQEIQQAALNGIGMAVRFSDTMKYDFLYVAEKIMHGSLPEGYIRLSMPLTAIDRSVNLLRIRIIFIVTAILLATGIFSFWQLDRIRRLTGRIRDFSRAIAQGDLGKKLFIEQAGEFDEIAESLNDMAGALKSSLFAHEEEQRRLKVILRSIPDALFIMDVNGDISQASTAAKNIFGDIPFTGRRFIEVVRNTEFASLMEDVRKRRSPGVAEVRIDTPFERYCVVQVSPLFYQENELSGFVAVFHDISRLKKLEQTRKDFVANISHELKTPITAITGFAETLLEGALDDREHAVKFLRTIKANSERINSLVDDLMTISKIELGVIRIEKTPLRFQDVAETVLEILKSRAAEKNLSLTISAPPGPDSISADRDRFTQILTNLVDNGIKFTEQGGVTFGLTEEGGVPVIFVSDTGIGIPQKHLPRVGERFYRVDPGRSRNMGGTGLGLAIVKHLVKAHGWDMQIESTHGKGTKVRIFLTQV